MNQNNNTSFSLLSQQEIDTLVNFLTEKKNTVDSDVMSQTSIDKLIRLIQTDKERLILNPFLSLSYAATNAAIKLEFRSDASEICELRCNINEETGFLELSIYNTKQDASYALTPQAFDDADTTSWGYAISPSQFNQIAYSLALKYTQATYDFVCSTFAKHNYGSAEQKISEFYLPDNKTLVESIL